MAYFTQYISIKDDFKHKDDGEDEYVCTLLHYTPGMMRAAEVDSVRIPAIMKPEAQRSNDFFTQFFGLNNYTIKSVPKKYIELSYEETVRIHKKAIEMLKEKNPNIVIEDTSSFRDYEVWFLDAENRLYSVLISARNEDDAKKRCIEDMGIQHRFVRVELYHYGLSKTGGK